MALYPAAGKAGDGVPLPEGVRPWGLVYTDGGQCGLRVSLGLCAIKAVFWKLMDASSPLVSDVLRNAALGPMLSAEWHPHNEEAAPAPRPVVLADCLNTECALLGERIGARPDQIQYTQRALRAPFGRGVLSLPTGFGKTWVAWMIATIAHEHLHKVMWGGKEEPAVARVLILVGSPTLAEQLEEDFAKLEVQASNQESPLVDSTKITTYGRAELEDLQAAHILLVDECHQVPAASRARQVAQCSATMLRVGLSATPFMRSDANNMWVAALLGPMLAQATLGHVIRSGSLARPDIKCHSRST